jgi:hypothetical protein
MKVHELEGEEFSIPLIDVSHNESSRKKLNYRRSLKVNTYRNNEEVREHQFTEDVDPIFG